MGPAWAASGLLCIGYGWWFFGTTSVGTGVSQNFLPACGTPIELPFSTLI